MQYIRIAENLNIIKTSDYAVLVIRDREAEDERLVLCNLNKKEYEKLREELGR